MTACSVTASDIQLFVYYSVPTSTPVDSGSVSSIQLSCRHQVSDQSTRSTFLRSLCWGMLCWNYCQVIPTPRSWKLGFTASFWSFQLKIIGLLKNWVEEPAHRACYSTHWLEMRSLLPQHLSHTERRAIVRVCRALPAFLMAELVQLQ